MLAGGIAERRTSIRTLANPATNGCEPSQEGSVCTSDSSPRKKKKKKKVHRTRSATFQNSSAAAAGDKRGASMALRGTGHFFFFWPAGRGEQGTDVPVRHRGGHQRVAMVIARTQRRQALS